MSKILITSALPYINGVKHLGNLVGSLLPADVHARFRRQIGDEVLFICGTDEHGTPAELGEKQKAFAVAAKAAYQRDPGGDDARQAKVKQVIERYSALKNSTNGRYIIDTICKENDELLAIYK